jgi:hypothetical protein
MFIHPFEGDRFLFGKVAHLCAQFKVASIVETGTQFGATTRAFALLAQQVVTIEREPIRLTWLPDNVLALCLSSDKALDLVIPNLIRPSLFFLDAHNSTGTALLDELKVIAFHNVTDSPIVIHDFKVPDKNFGFDVYGDKALDLAFTKEAFQPFIDDGYTVAFNHEAEGRRRGACFLLPRQ